MSENKYVDLQIILPKGKYLVQCKHCGKLNSMEPVDYYNGTNPCNCGKDK